VSSGRLSSRRARKRSSVEPGGSPSTGARPPARRASAGRGSRAARAGCRRPWRPPGGRPARERDDRGRPGRARAPGRPAAAGPPSSRSPAPARPGSAAREQHHDALGAEPPCGTAQRLQRRFVEPLEVVDHAQNGLRLGGQREQAEQRGADGQPRLRCGLLELQRARERRGLRGRQPLAQRERRLAQLRHPGERQLHLGLETARAQHRHPLGALDRDQQQRGLADPGLAAEQEHAAAAGARGLERALDALELFLATDQHQRACVPACRGAVAGASRTAVPDGLLRFMCRP
jgi:hypothetical protein